MSTDALREAREALEQAHEFALCAETTDHDGAHRRHFAAVARKWIEKARGLLSFEAPSDAVRDDALRWALERVAAEPSVHEAQRIARNALANTPSDAAESVEGERTHVWDDTLERCEVCGDKDWLAGAVCPGPSAKMEVFNEHGGSVVYGLPGLELMIDCAPGVQVTAQPNGRFLAERTPESAPLPWVSVKERVERLFLTVDSHMIATDPTIAEYASKLIRQHIGPLRDELSALPLPGAPIEKEGE